MLLMRRSFVTVTSESSEEDYIFLSFMPNVVGLNFLHFGFSPHCMVLWSDSHFPCSHRKESKVKHNFLLLL